MLRDITDIITYLVIISVLGLIFLHNAYMFVLFICWYIFPLRTKLYDTRGGTWDNGWVNWFEILKLLSNIVGVFVVVSMQLFGIEFNNLFYAGILVLNIIEASIRELDMLKLRGIPNFVTGIALCYYVIINIPISNYDIIGKTEPRIFTYPLSWLWILLYCLWNGTFTYGTNFSHTTRLCLVASIICSLYYREPSFWLVSRAYTLLLNQMLRTIEYPWIFSPGTSVLTKSKNSPKNDAKIHLLFSCITITIGMYYASQF